MEPTPGPVALTIPAAVVYSSLSRSRLFNLMRSNELQSFQVGGRRMILRAEIDAFFAKLSEGRK